MSRIDRKYWFHISKLYDLLNLSLPDYHILEINGQRLMEYETEYFDCEDNLLYFRHHRRELPRHKIRFRKYTANSACFLEVKLKTNKKLTVKNRIAIVSGFHEFNEQEQTFIQSNTPFASNEVHPAITNQFKRITLINKNKIERCTIDISPVFRNNKNSISLENLVIFELKKGHSINSSPMVAIARQLKIRQRGMSKYCTGRALLEPGLKQNAFKSKLQYLHKHIINQLS